MKTEIFKGSLTALSPIHTGGSETHGTIKPILTLPTVIRNAEGKEEIDNIPCIHGNSIRGYLRALIMRDFLDLLDYNLNSKKIYHFLFDGGLLEAVDAKDKGTIDLKLKDEIRTNIPPISLLGSAIGNQMIQGKMNVSIAEIVCAETEHYLRYEKTDCFSAYGLKSSDFGIRLDSLKEEREEGEAATQMIYEFETLIRGTKFTHEFVLFDCLPHERACFIRMLNLWNERPYIGGKQATGYGKISLHYFDQNGFLWKIKEEAAYIDYINENKDAIVSFMDELCDKFK